MRKVLIPLLALFLLLSGGRAFSRADCADCPQDPPPGENSENALFQQADEIFQEVSRLRGLPIKRPVKKMMADPAFFRDYYTRLLQEQYPPEKKRATEKAYILFGLLPAGTDLLQGYLDSFLRVVQGLYDPATKTLYIAEGLDARRAETVLAHELDHALQDQYFDLQAFLGKSREASMDTQFARSSLMEGEAAAIALNYNLSEKGSDFTRLANIADWVRLNDLMEERGQKEFGRKAVLNEVIHFPYVYGAAFLQKYVRAYGWQGMDKLFQHPPSSTHQIMHPEAFFPRRENPVRIRLENLGGPLLKGYRLIWEDTFGEYGLFLLLRQYVSEGEALGAVRGWRGDRVQVYETKDRHRSALAGYLLFRNAAGAEDFFRAYRGLLGKKYDLDRFRRSDDTIHWASLKGSEMEVYVERLGPRVVFIEGTLRGQTSRVRSALWTVVQPQKGRKTE